MAGNVQKTKPLDDARIKFLLARYSALRKEMQNRNANHYQMISLNLIISASILTFGLQPSSPASVLFVIPIMSMLLATVSTHNVIAGKELGIIIKNDIETEFNFVSKGISSQKHPFPGSLGVIAASGIFITVQTLGLILGLIKIQNYTTLDIVLIFIDVISLLVTLILANISIRSAKD